MNLSRFQKSVVQGIVGLSLGASTCLGTLLARDEPDQEPIIVKGQIGVAPVEQPQRDPISITYRLFHAGPTNSLGLSLQPADEALVSQLGLKSGEAHVVTQVQSKGFGEKAGIKLHDILLEVDGKPIKSAESLEPSLYAPGDTHPKLTLLRKGKRTTVEITDLTRTTPTKARYWLGIPVSPVPVTLREQLGLDEKAGLLITDVTPDSPAKRARIEKNDILLKIDKDSIHSAAQLVEEIQDSEGKPLKLSLLRSGKPLTIEVKPEKRTEEYIAQYYSQLNTTFTPFEANRTQVQPGLLLDNVKLDGLKPSGLKLNPTLDVQGNQIIVWDKTQEARPATAPDPKALQRIEALLKQSQDLLKQIKADQAKEIQTLKDELKNTKNGK